MPPCLPMPVLLPRTGKVLRGQRTGWLIVRVAALAICVTITAYSLRFKQSIKTRCLGETPYPTLQDHDWEVVFSVSHFREESSNVWTTSLSFLSRFILLTDPREGRVNCRVWGEQGQERSWGVVSSTPSPREQLPLGPTSLVPPSSETHSHVLLG